MDVHTVLQSDSGKLEQIISQFLLKSLHIILESRIPSLRPHDRSGDLSAASRLRKSDKWFNLVLGDRPASLDNLKFWLRNIMDPMIIDVILVHEGPDSSSVDNLYAASSAGTAVETLMERWVIRYDISRVMSSQVAESSAVYKKAYKKSIMLLRSLYVQMRLLPAYRIFRQLCSSTRTYNFDIIYKVSSFSDPFSRDEAAMMKEYIFAPVEAYPGHLCISVTYRSTLSGFNLEPSTSLPAKIITDYVGSPTTDPLRSFPSTEKGVGPVSFPLRGIRPQYSSSPFQRPHSWSSGFHKGVPLAHNQSLSGSPPAHRTNPYDFYSPPNDFYGNRVLKNRSLTNQRLITYDEYQLSTPFSPSASPSTPAYLSGGSPLQTHMRPESAPVTIPLPMTGKNSRHLFPNFSDSNRNSLPPMSPRSTKHDASSQESSSGSRSIRKSESTRGEEVLPGIRNYSASQKISKDSKDDSGRFSGLLSSSGSPRRFSRSSSRISFQDDLDDCDFSCPFDVDDVDTQEFQSSQSCEGRKSSESNSQSLPWVRPSQDAAVGVLVHTLRTAQPLRQDSRCYSSRSMKNDGDGGVSTASAFFVPKKTSDALEELRSYRGMRDVLLSKSRTGTPNKESQELSPLVGSSSS